MDRRRRADPPPTPPPLKPLSRPPSSPFLHDISNYKTPGPHSRNPNPNPSPLFFTASKDSPSSPSPSSARPSLRRKPFTPSLPHSQAARKLKALELEQSRSARKAEARKEKELKSFSRSVTAWLNFLFDNPAECGCQVGMGSAGGREWKRQRSCEDGVGGGVKLSAEQVSRLKESLKDVCSLEDLRKRMEVHMSKKACEEVLSIMSRLCKNIDDGRLKMKPHCPIVTDLALKEKAIRSLMCYNPLWLRMGLHIIFGGDSLLNRGGKSDQEDLLSLLIDRQFFAHMVIARSFAFNKLVEGVYRPGFFETLGRIILKRFLLLVISLDKAKCEITLPLKYGIDGIDGDLPPLFNRHSHIKSCRQIVQEFLSEAMHGEGDLLAHLAILGCKLNYQQSPLAEYQFKVKNLFEDLQDGIMLCRAIQLLKSDPPILSKLMIPSDTHKKKLQNCSTAFQFLNMVGVPLVDGDGFSITAEDIVNGDIELSLSILWNIFVHLQVPLLIDKTSFAREIARIKGSDMNFPEYKLNTEMSLLLTWVQVVCEEKGIEVCNFSSIFMGKAFRCLIDYYFRNDVSRYSSKENQVPCSEELRWGFDCVTVDAVQNFAIVQSVTSILGNIPEVFQLCDMLDQDASFDERSVRIFLTFLASQLISRKDSDILKCKATRSNHYNRSLKPLLVPRSPLPGRILFSCDKLRAKNLLEFESPRKRSTLDANMDEERAASAIQSHFKGYTARKRFLQIKLAATLIQTVVRAWSTVTSNSNSNTVSLVCSRNRPSQEICDGYLRFLRDRHRFLQTKKSVLVIQHGIRAWMPKRHKRKDNELSEVENPDESTTAVSAMQSFVPGLIMSSADADLYITQSKQQINCIELDACENLCTAAIKIQYVWRRFTRRRLHLKENFAAIKIQSYWRGWYFRKKSSCETAAVIEIQAGVRSVINQAAFRQYIFSAVEIQRFARGQVARKRLLGASRFRYSRSRSGSDRVSSTNSNYELKVVMHSILILQRWWKQTVLLKYETASAISIQSFIRGWSARRLTYKKRSSISAIQRRWRNFLVIKSKMNSAIRIQALVRGWLVRREAGRERCKVVLIQSHWRGYRVRKGSSKQVVDLRFRMQTSSARVDDSRRLINKLITALSELLGYRSMSNIRQTCATLNFATELSQKCCEELVAAGAVDILLKQFHLLNRGIPDQEVLKHVICTLRNISCYPHLLQVLIDTPQAVEVIFHEILRNKNDGFFVACELLNKICSSFDGVKAVRRLNFHVRRLSNLVQDLERKTELHMRHCSCRNSHPCTAKDLIVRRLKAAVDLLLLILDDQ